MKFILVTLLFICALSCKNEADAKQFGVAEIIEKSIDASGSKVLDTSKLAFKFRDVLYTAERDMGQYLLTRTLTDSTNVILDQLSNDSFRRFVNEIEIKVPDSMAVRYSNSVNSVHYFSVLPYGLDDDAVNLTYLDSVKLNNKPYHKIKVTFDEEGGGSDFEDVFIYWIHRDSYLIDFLAYEFHVNGGGIRFREAYNERIVSGIRFVDYNNYKPSNDSLKIEDIDIAYEQKSLDLLSKIELDSVRVN